MRKNIIKLITIASCMIAIIPLTGCSLGNLFQDATPVATNTSPAIATKTEDAATKTVATATASIASQDVAAATTIATSPVSQDVATPTASASDTPATVSTDTVSENIATTTVDENSVSTTTSNATVTANTKNVATTTVTTDTATPATITESPIASTSVSTQNSAIEESQKLAEQTEKETERKYNTWIPTYAVKHIMAYDETIYKTISKDCKIGAISGRNYTQEYEDAIEAYRKKPIMCEPISYMPEDDYTNWRLAPASDRPYKIEKRDVVLYDQPTITVHHDAQDITYFHGYYDLYGKCESKDINDTAGKTILPAVIDNKYDLYIYN